MKMAVLCGVRSKGRNSLFWPHILMHPQFFKIWSQIRPCFRDQAQVVSDSLSVGGTRHNKLIVHTLFIGCQELLRHGRNGRNIISRAILNAYIIFREAFIPSRRLIPVEDRYPELRDIYIKNVQVSAY